MPFVNQEAFEGVRRHQQITKYEIYPLQSEDIEDYQVLAENMPSLISEDVRIFQKRAKIPFWSEEKGKSWTKIGKLMTKTPQELFALSGNPSASSEKDGDDTFDFFDDFDYGSDSLTEVWTFESGAVNQKPSPFGLYDYNDDGVDEIYSVDSDHGYLYIFNWNGTKLREENLSTILHDWSGHPEYRYTLAIDVADIDSDGNEEIIFVESTQYHSVAPAYLHCIRLNAGSGFTELWVKTLTGKYECSACKIGNLTSTSGLQIVTSAGTTAAGSMVTYCWDKDGNEEWTHTWGKMAECQGIAIGDFGNGDGLDVAIIQGNGAGFRVLKGEDGTELWTVATGDGETFSVQDIDNDGKDDLLYGRDSAFECWKGSTGTPSSAYWTKAVSNDAEWVKWSPDRIDVGSGLEWLALSTGKHQYIYIQHQDGTDYKSLNIGSNSWSGHFSKLGGSDWKIIVGKDTGYSLNVYDLNLNLLASISGVGQIRSLESYENKIFISSNANPNQYAIYKFTEVEVSGNLTDKWELRNTPTVSGGELECVDDEYVVSKNSYNIRGKALEIKTKIIANNCKPSIMVGDIKTTSVTKPYEETGQDGYVILRDADRARGWRLVNGGVIGIYDDTSFYSGIDCNIFRKFKLIVQDNSPNYTTKHWHEKADIWYEKNSEDWAHTPYNMYIYLGQGFSTTPSMTTRIEHIFLRKYASPEPLILKRQISGKASAIRVILFGY